MTGRTTLPIILLLISILLLVIYIIISSTQQWTPYVNSNLPCNFWDSISSDELSNQAQHTNGSSIDDQYFVFNISNETIRLPVNKQQRLCVCSVHRPCVRLLCPRGHEYDESNGKCKPNENMFDPSIEVESSDGSGNRTVVQLFEHFGYTVGKICKRMGLLDQESPDDLWTLFEVRYIILL